MLLEVINWGVTDYAAAMRLQLDLLQRRISGLVPDTLVFTEHRPVYTLGRRKDAHLNLLISSDEMHRRGVGLHRSNRGGDITYHGPGQLVCYPVISLREDRDLGCYLRKLEQVLIEALAEFGLQGVRREGKTGIWLGCAKVAAMGIAVRQWIAYHGFALNVNVDLDAFKAIIPCGIPPGEASVTSMAAELSTTLDMGDVEQAVEGAFRHVFGLS